MRTIRGIVCLWEISPGRRIVLGQSARHPAEPVPIESNGLVPFDSLENAVRGRNRITRGPTWLKHLIIRIAEDENDLHLFQRSRNLAVVLMSRRSTVHDIQECELLGRRIPGTEHQTGSCSRLTDNGFKFITSLAEARQVARECERLMESPAAVAMLMLTYTRSLDERRIA